ncbi:MAG: hypothetical protein ACTSYJ_11295 [Candidatus Thorarchaeota archaeon]
MNTTSKTGKVAVGLFLILSVIVFGSLLYVGFTSVNTEIVVIDTAMEDVVTDDEGVQIGEYSLTQDPNLVYRRGPIEIVPDRKPGFRRGPIEIMPDYAPFERRGPIEIMPDYAPFERRGPIEIMPDYAPFERRGPIWLLPI